MRGHHKRADLEETAAAAGTAPKPSRFMPIPSRSMSCALPLGLETAGTEGVDLATGDFALAAAADLADSAATRTRSASSAFSRSRSYPSCRMRSASSAAFLSASAKSTGAAFFAPRPPSLDFFAPAEALPATDVADEFRREAPSLDAGREPTVEELERRDAELTVRGPVGALEALAERPMTGGAAGLEDVGAGLGAAGLSQDEKKSSSSPPAFGVGAAETSAAPSTTIFSGYLRDHQYKTSKQTDKGEVLSDTSQLQTQVSTPGKRSGVQSDLGKVYFCENSPCNILLYAARKFLLVQLRDAA